MSGEIPALSLSQVLVEECVEHFGEPLPEDIAAGSGDTPEYMAKVYDHLNKRDRWALCLSGGGIRSATFGLGLLQGLARKNLLTRFDYLSTVSGGGYIGSWLSAWAHRRGPGGQRVGIEAVQSELSRAAAGSEPPEIRHLRNYSNFLTPKLGLMSADTWTGIGVYLRNLLLHWLMLVPLFVLPMFPAYWGWQLLQGTASLVWAWIAFAAGSAALLWSMGFLSFNLPSARAWPLVGYLDNEQEIAAIQGRSQGQFLAYCLLPAVFAAACLSLGLAWFWQQPNPLENAGWIADIVGLLKASFGGYWQIPLLVLAGALGRFIAWYVALWRVAATNRRIDAAKARLGEAAALLKPSHDLSLPVILWELTVSLLCGAGGGLLVGVAVIQILGDPFVGTEMFGTRVSGLTHTAIYLCAAPPLFMLAFLVSESLFIGLTAYVTQDEDREWWGRAGGWMLIACLGWLVFHVLVIFGPVAIQWVNDHVAPAALEKYGGLPGLLSLATGALTALLGASPKTPSSGAKAQAGPMARMRGLVLMLAAGLFLVTLFAGLAWLLSQVLFAVSGGLIDCGMRPCAAGASVPTRFDASILSTAAVVLSRQQAVDWPAIILVFVALAAIGALAWRSINVNRFSMHATYRDRLVRCYLGAARGNGANQRTGHSRLRYPDRFTGFDPNDNVQLGDLAQSAAAPGNSRAPLHIVNIAVNLVNDKMLGWQQRKAASFTASALHAGSDIFGYRPVKKYGGDDGLSLGTAMAISGAAASPNMGYHSSPIVTLILALFNVRLGWWLGNPKRTKLTGIYRRPIYARGGPVWAAAPLIAECFGLTNRKSRFVYLSDGGHFENLGLYEMVRRRCRHIVVSDAGCDPDNQFADLGNAIRKIRVDLGIDIKMEAMSLHPRGDSYVPGAPRDGFYCGIGTIAYPEGKPGTIIYVKPGLYGGEPQDVLNYASENDAFPHEPTSDQWFSESQFESYRRLGQYVGEQVFDVVGKQDLTVEQLLDLIKKAAKRA
jgi:hypothetical protein